MDKINGKSNKAAVSGSDMPGTLTPINETGRRLIELRKARGFSQKDVAQKIGVNYTSYSAWEVGEYKANGSNKRQTVELKGKNITALADLYGVSCDYILARSEYTAVDGAAIAARTGLSDGAIRFLEDNHGLQYVTAARDVSQLLADYERRGNGSLLHVIHQYAQTLPDTMLSVNTNTGRQTGGGLYGTDVPVGGALLYLAVAALDQYRADVQADKTVSD